VSKETKRGRIIVMAIMVATIALSLANIALFNAIVGQEKLPEQTVRLGLTVLLMFFLYTGYSFARWIAVVLFGLGGLLAILGGTRLVSWTPLGFLMILLGVVYAASAIALAASSSVKAFLQAQRTST
jgi:hypothetical protein